MFVKICGLARANVLGELIRETATRYVYRNRAGTAFVRKNSPSIHVAPCEVCADYHQHEDAAYPIGVMGSPKKESPAKAGPIWAAGLEEENPSCHHPISSLNVSGRCPKIRATRREANPRRAAAVPAGKLRRGISIRCHRRLLFGGFVGGALAAGANLRGLAIPDGVPAPLLRLRRDLTSSDRRRDRAGWQRRLGRQSAGIGFSTSSSLILTARARLTVSFYHPQLVLRIFACSAGFKDGLSAPLVFASYLFQLFVRQVLQPHKSIVRFADANEFVQLHLDRGRVTVLGILNQEHHQKRHDGRSRVDDKLPCVRETEERTGNRPDHHGP